uniref:Olfactory receptor 10S1-like protein n=1 Tax=Alligator sinensis TaxID=38654 RepID=A0A7D3QRE6_ALLSI|nr:olfactory receptor 10S1-like protein [Alligator sinensis]
MVQGNETPVMEFILGGIPNTGKLPTLFFLLFLIIYLLTLLGNLLILVTILCDPCLHNLPMYFFLAHLSSFDACLSSVTTPKVLAGLVSPGQRTISFGGCAAQLYAFHFLASAECFLYTVMAYDRFLAVCYPLRYTTVMNRRVCMWLAGSTWLTGSLHATVHATLTFRLPYCGPHKVDYYFCDIPAVLKLACADTATNQAVILANIGAVAAGCFVVICISYTYIISAILKICTAEGRQQAFSTCSAHLTVVLLFYVPGLFIYVRPTSNQASDGMMAVFYTMCTPVLNPFIYTLRNKEVKRALRKLTCGQSLSVDTYK